MALGEGSNRRMRWQKQSRVFFSQMCSRSYKQQSIKTVQSHNKRFGGPDTSILELLKRKHDRAYLSADSEESMYVIMKCNTVTFYAKYVNLSLI